MNCYQCNRPEKDPKSGKETPFDVVGLMSAERCNDPKKIISRSPGGLYVTVPICDKCHKAPKVKAAFFYVKDQALALRLANLPTEAGAPAIQVPGAPKK